MGWFYGFKLHLEVNDKGEIISLLITQCNVDDQTLCWTANYSAR
jgi:hypothetical protein